MAEPVIQRKTWAPTQGKRGLECRYCGCRHFRVIYTRRGCGGKLIRRRDCRHCGKRMTTCEHPIGASRRFALRCQNGEHLSHILNRGPLVVRSRLDWL